MMVSAGLYWLLCDERYQVETKLIYLSGDRKCKDSPGLPMEKEIEILQSSPVALLAAQHLARVNSEDPNDWERDAGHSTALREDRVTAPTDPAQMLHSAGSYVKWLAENLSMHPEISGGTAKVTLRLQGQEPELLKAVLDTYVQRYVDYRLSLDTQSNGRAEEPLPSSDPLAGTKGTDPIIDRLADIELRERACKLAVKLIDSGKGVFSGFVPETNLMGLSSLAKFQDKIVQLEITKRALLVKFTPNSREIAALDSEIQGVRKAMREYLGEHLRFLKEGREDLMAQRREQQHKRGPVTGGGKASPAEFRGRLENGDAWFAVRDGLYMLRSRPVVTGKPLLVHAAQYKDRLMAYFSGSPVTQEDRTSRLSVDGAGLACSVSSNNAQNKKASWKLDLPQPPSWKAGLNFSGADTHTDVAEGPYFFSLYPDPRDSSLRLWGSLRADNSGRQLQWLFTTR